VLLDYAVDPKSSAHKLMSHQMAAQISSQNWPGLAIKTDLREGWGVYTYLDIKAGEVVCNYGGHLRTHAQVAKLADSQRNYLLEYSVVKNLCRKKYYQIHDNQTKFTYGKYLNHSKKHPCLRHCIYLDPNGTPEVMFIASKKIPAHSELCYDYGPKFKGVMSCVSSCQKCLGKQLYEW
jgi:hypothetical protein